MPDLTTAQMMALLADNTSGAISAADMRAIIEALAGRTDGTYPLAGLLLDTSPPAHTQVAGHLHWDTVDNTLGADVSADGSLQIGYEQWLNGRNTTGSTILNGTPVRIASGGGQDVFIAPDTGLGLLVGVATEDIANNTTGRVTTFGEVHDLNTAAFVDGAVLYATSTGTLSTTLTSSFVGVVAASHATQGVLHVSPDRRVVGNGTTAQRPTTVVTGFNYFDSTLGIPVFWRGAQWVNASGAVV